MCLETGENENCLETGEHEKCLETGENEKCLETRENEKCLDTGKIQHFPLRAERRRERCLQLPDWSPPNDPVFVNV